jgi:hypothetical protein
MGPGATIDAARSGRASMAIGSDQHINIEDGVFVHDCIVFQDSRGSWWAYRGGSVMFSADSAG